MLHGLPGRWLYYSLGVFNGDGPNALNADDRVDLIGRAWIAPLAATGIEPLERLRIGGSLWLGSKNHAQVAPLETTQGGFPFSASRWNLQSTAYELRQDGDLTMGAFEVDAPITPWVGLRFELVHKEQGLAETEASTGRQQGSATLSGTAFYVEAYCWPFGDQLMLPAPGLLLPDSWHAASPELGHGLMLAARFEELEQQVRSTNLALGDPEFGRTSVFSAELGLNYWFGRYFRGSFDYVLNVLNGDAPAVVAARQKNAGSPEETEFLFRLAVSI
jgi:hypothetical protein